MIHPKIRNINPHNITRSLLSRNPRERMFVVQVSLLIITFISLISQILSLLQTTKEVNPHLCIAPSANMWSVFFFFFFFLCHLLNDLVCICYIAREGQVHKMSLACHMLHQQRWEDIEFKFYSVTSYTNSTLSLIHVILQHYIISCALWFPKCDTTEFRVYLVTCHANEVEIKNT